VNLRLVIEGWRARTSIREACRQVAEWRAAGLDIPCVSVNLSPINFQNANLAAAVAGILASHGPPPETPMLEGQAASAMLRIVGRSLAQPPAASSRRVFFNKGLG